MLFRSEGEDGWVEAGDSGKLVLSSPELLAGRTVEEIGGYPATFHVRDFLDCVKSRAKCTCDIEIGHRSTSATLIANIAEFALGGKQTPELANFPFVFAQKELKVYPAGKDMLTAEMIGAIGRMQNAIVVLRERPPAAGGGDRFGNVREHARRLPRRIDVGRWQIGR